MNMFDNDGLINPNFGTAGQVSVLSYYDNQYVSDMITFIDPFGVHKAIVAGYVTNAMFSTTSSLVLQYILTPGGQGIDTSFGGFDANPIGVAFGDGKQASVVGQQSMGRIIVGGLSTDNLGLLLGYTAQGKLDTSFGNNGYQSMGTGSTGIYTHAIDTQNRIVIGYNDGSNNMAVVRFLSDGSAVDATFVVTSLISALSDNNNMKVAVDSTNNVIACAVTNTNNSITLQSYSNEDGTVIASQTFTGAQLGGSINSVYQLTRLLVDVQGNITIVAYDTYAQNIVTVKLTSSLTLDSSFDMPHGYLIYTVGGGSISQVAKDALIHPDGRILVVGCQA